MYTPRPVLNTSLPVRTFRDYPAVQRTSESLSKKIRHHERERFTPQNQVARHVRRILQDTHYIRGILSEHKLSNTHVLNLKQVQNTLFRVPFEVFETRSEVFRDMFSLPVGAVTATNGKSDDSPIVLEGVEAKDFKALLRLLYPKSYVKRCSRPECH